MCLEIRKSCHCGKQKAQLHMRDNVMTKEVLVDLYCPECSQGLALDQETMLHDNGWVIEFDMDLARFMAVSKLMVDAGEISPGSLFDDGYATWQEMYPGEQQDVLRERKEIMQLLEKDRTRYLEEINSWNIARVERLKEAGWRKAQMA